MNYVYTMRECITDYLTAMGAKSYSQIRNEVRVQCTDYAPNAVAPCLAQMVAEGALGCDVKRFAISTIDLVNAEQNERALWEQRIRDAVVSMPLFGPIPTSLIDDTAES